MVLVGVLVAGCADNPRAAMPNTTPASSATPAENLETATFGAGCFWCVEAVFQQLKGVKSVVSGYTGGQTKNPTYKDICNGDTGHAEVIQVVFDPKVISYEDLLLVFFKTHDPTTLNCQGNDVGTQYRSAIFTHNDKQKTLAEEYFKKIDDAKIYDAPLVTEIVPIGVFYKAEDYHQNYWNDNPTQGYCRMMIPPKLEKLKKLFPEKLK